MTSPLHLILVRHAAHGDLGQRLTGRADDVPLTGTGERQAEAVAYRLRSSELNEIHASPRLRALATAEAVASASGAGLSIERALDEIDFGDWTGCAFADLDGTPGWDHWNRARGRARPPAGESMAEAAARIHGHAASLATRRQGDRIVFVTHADIIRGLVATLLGLSLDRMLRIEVDPASISRVELAPWGATLIGLNDTSHLGGST